MTLRDWSQRIRSADLRGIGAQGQSFGRRAELGLLCLALVSARRSFSESSWRGGRLLRVSPIGDDQSLIPWERSLPLRGRTLTGACEFRRGGGRKGVRVNFVGGWFSLPRSECICAGRCRARSRLSGCGGAARSLPSGHWLPGSVRRQCRWRRTDQRSLLRNGPHRHPPHGGPACRHRYGTGGSHHGRCPAHGVHAGGRQTRGQASAHPAGSRAAPAD